MDSSGVEVYMMRALGESRRRTRESGNTSLPPFFCLEDNRRSGLEEKNPGVLIAEMILIDHVSMTATNAHSETKHPVQTAVPGAERSSPPHHRPGTLTRGV